MQGWDPERNMYVCDICHTEVPKLETYENHLRGKVNDFSLG